MHGMMGVGVTQSIKYAVCKLLLWRIKPDFPKPGINNFMPCYTIKMCIFESKNKYISRENFNNLN